MKTLITLAALLTLSTISLMAAELEEGAAAPDISQKTDEGKNLNISEAAKAGYALVYFYPKADTPGCTKQACSLRDEYEALTGKGVTVIGVSADTVEDQKAFKEKFNLTFTLLADKDGKVIDAFGVPKNPKGLSARRAFLFKDGKLVYRDLEGATTEQAANILAIVK